MSLFPTPNKATLTPKPGVLGKNKLTASEFVALVNGINGFYDEYLAAIDAIGEGFTNQAEIITGYDIIVEAGQSNTIAGRSYDNNMSNQLLVIDQITHPTHDDILMLGWTNGANLPAYNNKVLQAREPLQQPEFQIVPERCGHLLDFARRYVQQGYLKAGRKVLLIQGGVGSTSFINNNWNKGNGRYENLKDKVDYALNTLDGANRVVAVLGQWGEDDTTDFVDGATFQTRFDNFHTDFYSDLNLNKATVPFMVGSMVPYWVDNTANAPIIEGIIEDAPNRLTGLVTYMNPRVPTVITKDDDATDSIHYNEDGHKEIAKRHFDNFLGIYDSIPVAPIVVTGVSASSGVTSAVVVWDKPLDAGLAIKNYNVYYKLAADSIYTKVIVSNKLLTTVISGLTISEVYNVYVTTTLVNNTESAPSNIANVTILNLDLTSNLEFFQDFEGANLTEQLSDKVGAATIANNGVGTEIKEGWTGRAAAFAVSYYTTNYVIPTSYTISLFLSQSVDRVNSISNVVSAGTTSLFIGMSGTWRIAAGHGSAFSTTDTEDALPDTKYHVVVTYDLATTTQKLYVNGALKKTNSSLAAMGSPRTLNSGRYNSANTSKGNTDMLRVFGRVLTDAEVLALYNQDS